MTPEQRAARVRLPVVISDTEDADARYEIARVIRAAEHEAMVRERDRCLNIVVTQRLGNHMDVVRAQEWIKEQIAEWIGKED